jgi:NADPH-dependent curcumin reductase CurA
VGSVVGQLLKSRGADAIGLTGDDAKVQQCMTSYGYKLALNYKSAGLAEKLAHCAPQGFQIYFDNTGGPILDLAIRNMALYGRIVQCGTAATASWSPAPTGMRNEREILLRRLSWNGFVIFDHIRRFPDAIAVLEPMVIEGALHYEEDITPGLRSAASGLADVFSGKNRGKKLISIIQTLA